MVVAPDLSKTYIKEAGELNIKYIWFQPDTHNSITENLVRENNIESVYACVLVALQYRGEWDLYAYDK